MSDPVDFASERVRRLPMDTNPAELTAIDTLREALRDEQERVAAGGAPTDCCIVLMERGDAEETLSRGYYGGPALEWRSQASERLLRKAIEIIVDGELRQRGLG